MAQDTHHSTSSSGPGGTSQDIRNMASEQLGRAADQLEGAVKTVAERGREVGQDMQAVAGNFQQAVDSSVKNQPMATLAVAGVLGFVLGALWKS